MAPPIPPRPLPLLPVARHPPRLVLYAQTYHTRDGQYISLLPLLTQNTGVTHVILAALHLNEGPGNITLNDDPPDHPKYDTLWGEVRWLLGAGVKVMLMVGGAAKGSWERLSGPLQQVSAPQPVTVGAREQVGVSLSSPSSQRPVGRAEGIRQALRSWLYKTFIQPRFRRFILPLYEAFSRAFIAQPPQPRQSDYVLTPSPQFDAYIQPVIALIRKHNLSGLDLDIEETVPLSTPVLTIQRLHAEFGPDFLLTLAPTCTALLPHTVPNPAIPLLPYHFSVTTPVPPGKSPCSTPTLPHLSGFSYPELFASPAGPLISWFNAQFYCGWGDASQPAWYDAIIASGWPADKIVFGVVTTPRNGAGYVRLGRLREVLRILRARHPSFGGTMGWEFFNSGSDDPELAGSEAWSWVKAVGEIVRSVEVQWPETVVIPGLATTQPSSAPPTAQVSWPGEDVQKLVALGFDQSQAVAALNATGGNVELAAGLLFDP